MLGWDVGDSLRSWVIFGVIFQLDHFGGGFEYVSQLRHLPQRGRLRGCLVVFEVHEGLV